MNGTQNKSKRVENGHKTLVNILGTARQLFSEKGYGNTSMEEIVQKIGVTRGALYHHFSGKKGLFLRVFEEAQSDVARRLDIVVKEASNAWEKLISATDAYLEACIDPDLQRIILIDAPSILGWDVWRQVDEAKSMVILKSILVELMDEGIIEPLPVDALSRYIGGAVNESVLWVAQSQDPQKALEEARFTIKTILGLLKKTGCK